MTLKEIEKTKVKAKNIKRQLKEELTIAELMEEYEDDNEKAEYHNPNNG